jgi:hypothetical protein
MIEAQRPILSTPCWRCLRLERPEGEGAMRLSLCDLHLREQIRIAMGLQKPEAA